MFGPDCNKCGGVFPGNPNGNGESLCRCQTYKPLRADRSLYLVHPPLQEAIEAGVLCGHDPMVAGNEEMREAAFEKAMTPLEDPSAKFEAAMAKICPHDFEAGQPYPDQLYIDGNWVATFPIKCKVCGAVGTSTVGPFDRDGTTKTTTPFIELEESNESNNTGPETDHKE